MTTPDEARFTAATALLADVRDVVAGRPDGAAPPTWCERRGWTSFLAAFPADALAAAERDGLARHLAAMPGAPDDLAALALAVTLCTTLPTVPASSPNGPRRATGAG